MRRRFWRPSSAPSHMSLESRQPPLERLCESAGTDSFITVPVYGHRPIGRLYATSRRFRHVEPGFSTRWSSSAVVENIQLLAARRHAGAASASHDGTIQPYIGLNGLETCAARFRRHSLCRGSRRPRMAGNRRAAPLRHRPREQGPRAARESLLVAYANSGEIHQFTGSRRESRGRRRRRLKGDVPW
jgi:hypothetical protein